jgi:hypothetical protein
VSGVLDGVRACRPEARYREHYGRQGWLVTVTAPALALDVVFVVALDGDHAALAGREEQVSGDWLRQVRIEGRFRRLAVAVRAELRRVACDAVQRERFRLDLGGSTEASRRAELALSGPGGS